MVRPNARRADPIRPDAARSAIMRAVRRSGTGAEVAVARILRARGFSLKKNVTQLPGSPDLVLRDRQVAIFVHGCFWHRHPRCRRATTPKRNRAFWIAKFTANVARDRRNQRQLRALGFDVLVIWECQIAPVKGALKRQMLAARKRPTISK